LHRTKWKGLHLKTTCLQQHHPPADPKIYRRRGPSPSASSPPPSSCSSPARPPCAGPPRRRSRATLCAPPTVLGRLRRVFRLPRRARLSADRELRRPRGGAAVPHPAAGLRHRFVAWARSAYCGCVLGVTSAMSRLRTGRKLRRPGELAAGGGAATRATWAHSFLTAANA
jgi:hypothetical protein